ncbi:hypothetical protein A4H97_00250 [Niastella yeongjuensis]|uniref:Gliding motility-associated C-terminal domain-containing protein n=1 Tax=Niastella yeongjuensis TaxID=354355 RepID=A0A1V9EVX6_9BACT|nr:hypothetical protein [Niastella yeongjuensis]OQP50313.1 hypothetical protein A4H97_00250 [Niastella yeongjuensis]
MYAGVYTVYIKDANGVINRYGANILKKCEFSIDPNVFNATCGNLNGQIQAIAKEGVRPYQFSIDGINFQNSANFPGLAPGAYTITAKAGISFRSRNIDRRGTVELIR